MFIGTVYFAISQVLYFGILVIKLEYPLDFRMSLPEVKTEFKTKRSLLVALCSLMMTLQDFLFLYYSCLQKKNYEKVKAHAKRDKNVPGNLKRDEIFKTIYHRSASRQPAIVSPAHARASISLSRETPPRGRRF